MPRIVQRSKRSQVSNLSMLTDLVTEGVRIKTHVRRPPQSSLTHHTEVSQSGGPDSTEVLGYNAQNTHPREVPSSPCARRCGQTGGRCQAPEVRPETTYPRRLGGAPLTGASEA